MAASKKFNVIYQRVKETVYSQPALALTVLAAANSAATFTPVLSPNGVTATTSSYTLQRKKRPAVNTVANATAGTTAAALAALDQFSKED